MRDATDQRATAQIAGQSLYAMLMPFPVVAFIGAFATDIVYTQTANVMWQYFSIWLITAGLVMGGLAALMNLIDYVGARDRGRIAPRTLVFTVVMLLSLLNAFVHSRDGWTAVVPQGIVLSGIVTLLLVASAWVAGPRRHTAEEFAR